VVHPPTHDVTRHAKSRAKRVTSQCPEMCDGGRAARRTAPAPWDPTRPGSCTRPTYIQNSSSKHTQCFPGTTAHAPFYFLAPRRAFGAAQRDEMFAPPEIAAYSLRLGKRQREPTYSSEHSQLPDLSAMPASAPPHTRPPPLPHALRCSPTCAFEGAGRLGRIPG